MINSTQRDLIKNYGSFSEKSLLESYINLENEKEKYFSTDEQYEKIQDQLNIIETKFSLLDTFNEEIFFEMSKLSKEKTKLSCTIWIDDAGKERINKHQIPRIKVLDPNDSHNFISVSISKTPEILAGEFKKKININDIFNFIKINYIDLMKIWKGQADFLDIFGKKY